MTWRYNNAGSFILPVSFYNYIDFPGTDTTNSMEGPQGTFSPFRSHYIYLIHAFSSCIMTKVFPYVQPFAKHLARVLSSTTPIRSIPMLIIPGLEGDVNYMIVTLTIFLDLDLFHSPDYDTELIERDNDISAGWDVSWLRPRYGIEFMGYQVSWWSSRLWGSRIIQFSFNVWLNNWLDYLVLKWPWHNSVNRRLIPYFSLNSSWLQIQLVMILRKVQLPDWIVSSEWVNPRKILNCIMWYVFFLVCIILMSTEKCICLAFCWRFA